MANAVEQSTYIVTVAFTDDAGAAVVPNAGLYWSLLDLGGNAVNSRGSVSMTPGTAVDVVLSGNDLAIGANGYRRVLLVQGTYNSSAGTALPLKQEYQFSIDPLIGVS